MPKYTIPISGGSPKRRVYELGLLQRNNYLFTAGLVEHEARGQVCNCTTRKSLLEIEDLTPNSRSKNR